MPDTPRGSAAKGMPRSTGLWAVCVFESKDYLLAVHGPYDTRDAASTAADDAAKAPGIYAAFDVPLWDVRDLKGMLSRA